MKTVNFLKSKTDPCRRKIVIAEINILINLDESHASNKKIVREMGKLHSFWFKGTSKGGATVGRAVFEPGCQGLS